MDKFELKPPFLNTLSIFFLIVAITTSLILGFTVFPKSYDLYLNYPSEPVVYQVISGISVAEIMVWLMFAGSVIASKSRKIVVDKGLVYFVKKTKLGFGEWSTDKIIDFSKIIEVNERKKTIYTGKTVIIYYLLIFHTKDNGSFEMLLNGWDIQSMKNLFFYMRGRYPAIKFNNIVLKDSSEKLSGLTDLLSK